MTANNPPSRQPEFLPPAIRRARIGTLTIYEISDTELDVIERGSPDSFYFNAGIFFLSTALTSTATLLTGAIVSPQIRTVFIVAASIGYGAGLVLLVVWARSKKSITQLITTIRNRLPSEGFQQRNIL